MFANRGTEVTGGIRRSSTAVIDPLLDLSSGTAPDLRSNMHDPEDEQPDRQGDQDDDDRTLERVGMEGRCCRHEGEQQIPREPEVEYQ